MLQQQKRYLPRLVFFDGGGGLIAGVENGSGDFEVCSPHFVANGPRIANFFSSIQCGI
jgi:hypothetical protein